MDLVLGLCLVYGGLGMKILYRLVSLGEVSNCGETFSAERANGGAGAWCEVC